MSNVKPLMVNELNPFTEPLSGEILLNIGPRSKSFIMLIEFSVLVFSVIAYLP